MTDSTTETSDARQEQMAKPLSGRTVVITRARPQAAQFAALLEGYGARVLACPTIEIVEPLTYQPLDEAIENLYGYDWLVFTSVNGVEHFLRRLFARSHDVSELDDLRVCAIGEATAERLREARVHVDVIPDQFKAEGVFSALEHFLGGREQLRGQNFLIPRAAVARDYLPRALEAAGARADVIAAYRTVQPHSAERGRVEALLTGGAVDCITFTSSSTITNFAQMFEATDLSEILKGVTIACIGDITAKTAAQFGLRTDIQPHEYTIPALARAIADHYGKG
ncbi:MAG TPA: uroporphyrinogen-III synthase [Pyrinomonadaceae bacterium]|jgi:uroporphyrinogen III methyltransferase/synthase